MPTDRDVLEPAADVMSTGVWSADDSAFADDAGTYGLIIGRSRARIQRETCARSTPRRGAAPVSWEG